MAPPIEMDPQLMRCASQLDVVKHLKAALEAYGEEAITSQLIDLVDCGSITPSTFATWLGISSSSQTLARALRQEISVSIRLSAIKELGKRLRASQWKETWDGLGDVAGFLKIFNGFSEVEVEYACRTIGRSAKEVDGEEKRKSFTELYRALQPQIFATPHIHLDERPLQKHYQDLLPACTDDMTERIIKGDHAFVSSKFWRKIMQNQSVLLQAETLKYIFHGQGPGEKWLKPLLLQYPSLSTPIRGFSASMLFSLEVLRELVKHGHSSLRGGDLEKDLLHPLLKRALKRKVSYRLVEEIVQLSVVMLGRSSAIKELDTERGGILHMVAQCWSREPELFERDFRTLLASTLKWQDGRQERDLVPLMIGISRNRRYAILELCFNAIGRDINKDFGIVKNRLLSSLPAEAAFDFLTRLRSAKGDENLVESASPFSSSQNGEPDLWFTILLRQTRRQKDAEELASRQIEVHKKAALNSSTPELRAMSANSVIDYAMASGSIDLYGKELLWARRYIRDPLLVRTLWSSHVDATRDFLVGVPETYLLKDAISIDELGERISSANKVLRELFETVFLALRGPSFRKSYWDKTLYLPFFVVQERIRRTADLKKRLGFSDGEIYEIMWKDTLKTLVHLEKEILVPGRKNLFRNHLRGIFGFWQGGPFYLHDEEPCTYQFFDQYAKARNEIWREFRPTVDTAVTTLPEPFPRGLPIHYLTYPFILQVPSLEEYAPYLASRVKDAVFPDPKVALVRVPTEKERKMAMEYLVDGYFYALEMYAPRSLDEDKKRQRLEKAWSHATGPLSTPRLTPKEAQRYWSEYSSWSWNLTGWPPVSPKNTDREDWLTVPEVEDLLQSEEWNPVRPERSYAKPRRLVELTYIDLCKSFPHALWPSKESMMSDYKVTIPGEDAQTDNLWSKKRLEYASFDKRIREGLILSALLYLDTFNAAQTRILSQPFPSFDRGSARFPAVYFDGDWLEKTELNSFQALMVLRALIQHVPPTLLEQVARNTVDRFNATKADAEDFHILEEISMNLIKLLGESDRPALASRLAIRCFIDHPGASFWLQQILCPSFFKRLPANEAEACIKEFAGAIFERLEEQERKKAMQGKLVEASAEQDKGQIAKDSKPLFVKITTLKFLSELLRDTSFVPRSLSFSLLSDLMRKASHMDIRLAGASSLLESLSSPSATSETVDKIVAALKVAIPLAGNMRERDPILASEWEEAEELLRIPEITEANIDADDIPMLSLLLNGLKPKPGSMQSSDAYRSTYITHIILPILDSLKQQTLKWTSVFLRRHGIPVSEISNLNIPPIPLHWRILDKVLLLSSAYVPLSLLEEYMAYLEFNITPPPAIADLNKRLRADPVLRSSNPVKFWLSRYACGFGIINSGPRPASLLSRLLLDPVQLDNNNNITPVHVQQKFLNLLTLALWHDADDLRNVDVIMSSLWNFSSPTQVDKNWTNYHKPIVEAAIAYIEGLRSRDWERASNQDRKPSFLPDTFEYRMWLLQYACCFAPDAQPLPHPDPATATAPQAEPPKVDPKQAHISKLAKRIRSITDSMAGTMYHEKYARLKEALRYLGDEDDEVFRIALLLGDTKKTKLSWLSKQDLLSVHLATSLIDISAKPKDEEVENRVRLMLEEWKECESESVRRLGVGLLAKWKPSSA